MVARMADEKDLRALIKDLEGELEAMQEEELQNHLLSTGHVPVSDKVGALPAAPQAGLFLSVAMSVLTVDRSQRESPRSNRR